MEKFYWGCSTAAAQIEGGYNEDGKGSSIWDYYSLIKGKIKDGSTNQISADSYHKYKDDIKLLKELGCNAYRFSIAWTRIIPDGKGKINEKGLDYYNNVIDECLKNGIEPFITLYHWDMPLSLFKDGGFLNPNFVENFAYYCEIVVSRFHNKVKNWMVVNEPTCIIGGLGGTDSDKEYSMKELLHICHVINLCTAKGTQIIHKYGCLSGSAYCGLIYAPEHDDNKIEYEEAKRRTMILEKNDLNIFSIFTDPAMTGKYPKRLFEVYSKEELPNITNEDLQLIKNNTCDFIGINAYFAFTLSYENGEFVVNKNIDKYRTTIGWHVYDKSLYWAAKIMTDVYHKPFYISENGIAVLDENDEIRSKYLKDHINYLLKAKREGVDVRGYFYWSLMDNFEWFHGYTQKFGLIRIDRSVKNSFYTYKEIIKMNS